MEAAQPSPSRRVRPTRSSIVSAVLTLMVVVVVVAVAAWAVVGLRPPGATGGASSAAELGEELLDRLATQHGPPAASLLELSGPDERAVLAPDGGVPVEIEAMARLIGLDQLAEVVESLGPALAGTSVRVSDGWASGMVALSVTADDGLGSPVTARMTAVEHEGRWYLGLLETAVDALLGRLDPIPGVPEPGLVARGGRTPEEVVDRLLRAAEGLDLRRLLSLMHPGGAGAVQQLAPVLLDEVQAALDQVPLRWRVGEVSFEIAGSGEIREVVFERLMVGGVAGPLGLDHDLATAADTLQLRRQGGEWFIDPGSGLLAAVLALVPVDEADPLVLDDLVARIVTMITGELLGLAPALAAAFTDAAGSDVEARGEETSDVERCYGLADVAEAVVCFADGMERGVIEPTDVPVEVRFPECGAAEVAWVGYAQLDDDSFLAIVGRVRPCLLEQVAAGRLSADELPLIAADPECFEGRNWFAVLDDFDYSDRVIECARP